MPLQRLMIDFTLAGADILRAAIGKRIAGLARSQYLFNGVPDGSDAGSLELRFQDGSVVTLSLASDGESVRAHRRVLEIAPSFELDSRSRCSFERIDLLENRRFSDLRNAVLASVEGVVERWRDPPHRETISGWLLRFDTGDYVTYFNYGDDSRLLINESSPTSEEVSCRLVRVAE